MNESQIIHIFYQSHVKVDCDKQVFEEIIKENLTMKVQWTGKSIRKLSLYRRRINPLNLGYGLEHIPFAIFYAYSLYHCILTCGEPYAHAIRDLEEQGYVIPSLGVGIQSDNEGLTGLAASTLAQGVVREDITNMAGTSNSNILDTMDYPTLPNPYLPAIVPLLFMLATTVSHILMLLLQVWFVPVRAFIKYTPVQTLQDATYVMVMPRSYKGKSLIVSLEYIPEKYVKEGTSQLGRYFMFQKHKYIAEQMDNETKEDILFRKLKATTTDQLRTYVSSEGLESQSEIDSKLELFGKNEFHIPQPNFIDMFKQQLLEPLTVFQIFSVCLYMLDEYWQYSLFTLGMILMFEGVTVMSRLKNLQTLRGMGNQNRELFVYRMKKWQKVNSELLVPGDLISIKRETDGDHDNMTPCDVLLLEGSAVMNEATLTGESVPQMKEAIGGKGISESDLSELLDMKSMHKVHVLFGGTTVMQSDASQISQSIENGSNVSSNKGSVPIAPDNGCTAYVLRTGFSSSQGKLVRMIEYSSGKVSGSSWDAYGLAFLLMIFAFMSSGYVLKHGINEKGKITFELLLRCVLIITSVIPAELPMQTAMAVNSALMSLVKLSIFCTEPFRISLAGKVDICLFDKTGTLTTDQLTAVGVVCPKEVGKEEKDSEVLSHVPMIAAGLDATLVLAGCQSLVQIEGKMIGDPVEEASIRAIDFSYDATTRHCQVNQKMERESERTWGPNVNQKQVYVQILHRHHFASKLQRMSVIAKLSLGSKTQGQASNMYRSLVKGSPEAVAKLLVAGSTPSYYWPTYRAMARKGMRVLALAYKDIPLSKGAKLNANQELEYARRVDRHSAESDLTFAGFAIFQCLVRKDSKAMLKQLMDSSHQVSMITGDATLTAIHVSKEVGIITREALILNERSTTESSESSDKISLEWVKSSDDSVVAPYADSTISALEKTYDLCVHGKSLAAASEFSDSVWKNLNHIRVFARMTPELKENVLTQLKKNGHYTLMCGDGGNDVGALKQAHVGVALLGGFGSANADKSVTGLAKFDKSKQSQTPTSTEELMKLHVSVLKKKMIAKQLDISKCREKKDFVQALVAAESQEANKKKQEALAKRSKLIKKAPTKEEKAEALRKKTAEIEADIVEREARGESFARIKAYTAFAKREAAEAKKQRDQLTGSKGFQAFANKQAMAQYMDDFEDGEVPMVKLGDASIASPFTSRAPSIRGCVDIIRQGRCALVTTMQMYQILAVNCLISSYSLSVLYLDKVKYANSQLMALGLIGTVASITLSRATPLPTLSTVRPLTSIFHPALFSSIVGQFILHLMCMIYLTGLAKEYTPEAFHPEEKVHTSLESLATAPKEYQPNVMSTVIFLVNGVQTVSVCAINYKGRPFMKSMTDNPGLLYSLGISILGVFLLCTEAMPLFNKVLQIVPMPDPRFARILTFMLALDVVGAFLWDQLCLFIFAPKIFIVGLTQMTLKDVKQLIKMAVICFVVIYILANIDYDEIERQQKLLEEAEALRAKEAAEAAANDTIHGISI